MYQSPPSPPYHYNYSHSHSSSPSPFPNHSTSPPSPYYAPPSPPPHNSPRPRRQVFDAFLVADFEATCERSTGTFDTFGYPNQIIEFAVVLLKWRRVSDESGNGSGSEDGSRPSSVSSSGEEGEEQMELYEADSFRSYVRPLWRPTLSKFCTELTGIQQHEVDSAPLFKEVLNRFYHQFILPHSLFTSNCHTTWVTDGPWDLRDFIRKTLYINGLSRPRWLSGNYIDLRHSFAKYMNFLSQHTHGTLPNARYHVQANGTRKLLPSSPSQEFLAKAVGTTGIEHMLSRLALGAFEGTQHVGIDDTRNIARIVRELARRSWILRTTANLPGPEEEKRERRWDWMIGMGRVDWVFPPPAGEENEKTVVTEVVVKSTGSKPIPIPISKAATISPPRSLPPSLHERPPYGPFARNRSPNSSPSPSPMQFGSIPSPPLVPTTFNTTTAKPQTPTSPPLLPLTPPTPTTPTKTATPSIWYSAPPKAPSNFMAVRAGRRVTGRRDTTERASSPTPAQASRKDVSAEPRSVVGGKMWSAQAQTQQMQAQQQQQQGQGRWIERESRGHHAQLLYH